MRNKLFLAAIAVFLLTAVSCERIFSTSLAPWAARDTYGDLTALTYADASRLLDEALANNNRQLAASLLPVFIKTFDATEKTAENYTTVGKDLFDCLYLASNLTTAFNTLILSLMETPEPDETFLSGLAETFASMISWNDSFSAAMTACLDPDLFVVIDPNALGLAAFALVMDVGEKLGLNTLDPTTITEPADIDRLKDDTQFQLVLNIIDALSGVDPEQAPFVAMFATLFADLTSL